MPGEDLGFDKQDPEVGYLPAYIRYSRGRAYEGIGEYFWETIKENSDKIDALFISGLYGVARFTEFIRYYDIDLGDKSTYGKPVYKFWTNILPQIIVDYAINTNVKQIVVLSSYRYLQLLVGLRDQCDSRGILLKVPYLGSGWEVLTNIGIKLMETVNKILKSG